VVSFTTRPLYPQGKSSWYALDRRLGGPQSRSGHSGEERENTITILELMFVKTITINSLNDDKCFKCLNMHRYASEYACLCNCVMHPEISQ
jgi:hypothetical protein